MQTKMSSKGQVVLPVAIRKKLNIQTGDPLQIIVKNEEVRLVPKKPKKRKGRIIRDPLTGMAVVTFGPGAPIITCEMVDKLLEDFP